MKQLGLIGVLAIAACGSVEGNPGGSTTGMASCSCEPILDARPQECR